MKIAGTRYETLKQKKGADECLRLPESFLARFIFRVISSSSFFLSRETRSIRQVDTAQRFRALAAVRAPEHVLHRNRLAKRIHADILIVLHLLQPEHACRYQPNVGIDS